MTETMTAALQNPTRQEVLDGAVRFIGGLSQRYPVDYEAIDVAAAEAMTCPVCGGPCHSYVERNNGHRTVLAVCSDVRCGREVAI